MSAFESDPQAARFVPPTTNVHRSSSFGISDVVVVVVVVVVVEAVLRPSLELLEDVDETLEESKSSAKDLGCAFEG